MNIYLITLVYKKTGDKFIYMMTAVDKRTAITNFWQCVAPSPQFDMVDCSPVNQFPYLVGILGSEE